MAKKRELTDLQRRVVEHYLANGKVAVETIKAVTSTKLTGRALTVYATKFMQKPAIKDALAEAEKRAVAKTSEALDRYAVTKERIVAELAKIAFADPTDVLGFDGDGVYIKDSKQLDRNVTGAISEVSEVIVKDYGKTIKVKQHDKQAALQALARIEGMMTEKHEHKHMAAVKFIIET